MLDLLASQPLFTIFLVVALGALVGAIPFGPLRFGAAGALFVGLALGALDPRIGEGLALAQSLGLALFVYTVGLAAGHAFFRDLRTQSTLLGLAVAVLLIAIVFALGVGHLLGLDAALWAGTFAGALTATPALAAAIGYSLGYPVGVVMSILVVAAVMRRSWPSPKDPEAGDPITAVTIKVDNGAMMREVPGWRSQQVRFSYLQRGEVLRVIVPGEELMPGDRVVCVGQPAAIRAAADFLGRVLSSHLAHDRSIVGFRHITLSNPQLAGRTVAELAMPDRFGGVITRVRRGDQDLLATDDLTLDLGDRLLTVVPRSEEDKAASFLGDSERKVSEVDALAMGLGLVAGLLLGLVQIPLPGGGTFSLGAAAGPLVAGLVLGRLERSGPIVWGLPMAANLTIRQLGLMLFLAAVGLSSGQAFASQAFTMTGVKVISLAVGIVLVTATVFLLGARLAGYSMPRTVGAFAGLIGQPAILSFATARSTDPRIDAGYAPLFAVGIITKIVLVTLFLV